jgi:hypothetical protein
MANPTMTLIGTPITVGSGTTTSVTFSSIPATYTDLKLVMSVRTNIAEARSTLGIVINSDTTGANYPYRILYAVAASSNGSTNGTGASFGYVFYVDAANATASTFGSTELYIPNYSGSANKSISQDGVAESNDSTNNAIGLTASNWNSTAAITSISLLTQSSGTATGAFVQYSTFYLYGISKS